MGFTKCKAGIVEKFWIFWWCAKMFLECGGTGVFCPVGL